ncbi:hypothetical protein L3i22_065530 [Actinoplanes sp. L3-i22]|nr:hypothetical protein L3i22_065530 [Actinoplanes sp. L3-i22]
MQQALAGEVVQQILAGVGGEPLLGQSQGRVRAAQLADAGEEPGDVSEIRRARRVVGAVPFEGLEDEDVPAGLDDPRDQGRSDGGDVRRDLCFALLGPGPAMRDRQGLDEVAAAGSVQPGGDGAVEPFSRRVGGDDGPDDRADVLLDGVRQLPVGDAGRRQAESLCRACHLANQTTKGFPVRSFRARTRKWVLVRGFLVRSGLFR